jgi:NADH:ubiquinone oxidoreductase subunit K
MNLDPAFWSSWAWPAATAVLGVLFFGLVFRQYIARRRSHQLAWSVGLLLYAIAAGMEAWSEQSGQWDPTVYRIYIVLAASLVGFLGLGTLYLVDRGRRWGDLYLGSSWCAWRSSSWARSRPRSTQPSSCRASPSAGRRSGPAAASPG